MKKTLIIITMIFAMHPVASVAQNSMETTNDSIAQHSSDNYQYQQQNGTPLGGYPDTLGNSAPAGTINPGYNGR